MTIEEAWEYWVRRLERAENYSDEHWDAEERHAHKDYVDAMTYAITALAICREREEAEKNLKTNADRIRQMTDEELAKFWTYGNICAHETCGFYSCEKCVLKWLRKEAASDENR